MNAKRILWLCLAMMICPLAIDVLPRARAQIFYPYLREQTQDDKLYAVIAYSPSTRNWVAVSGVRNQVDAEESAYNLCNKQPAEPGFVKVVNDSKVAGWVANGWCALALSRVDRNHFTFGWADTPERAMELALWEAQNRAWNCYIAVVVNSSRSKVTTSRDQ